MADSSKRALYEENEIMVLEFDDGESFETGIMGTFDVNGLTYIALEELNGDNGDVYLYRYIENGDEFELDDIPEEDFDAVKKEFDAIMDAE